MLVPKLTAVLNDESGETAGQALGVERQDALESLHGVHGEDADEAERQQRRGVPPPVHLGLGIDPAEPIDEALHRPQEADDSGDAPLVDPAP